MFLPSPTAVTAAAFLTVVLPGAASIPASAQDQIVEIAAQTDPVASGRVVLDTVDRIRDATSSKPYIIRLGPGTYDVGSTMLQMKPHVDLEGASPSTTVVRGTGYDSPTVLGVVRGASSSALRNLQIQSIGAPYRASVALLIQDADTVLDNVTLVSSGASEVNYGLRHIRSKARLDGVSIDVRGGATSIGISNTSHGSLVSPSIRRTSIQVSGSRLSSIGISTLYLASLSDVRELRINVSGPDAIGIRVMCSYGTQSVLNLVDSDISATGSRSAVGLLIELGQIWIWKSQIRATSQETSVGISFTYQGAGKIDSSIIAGATNTVLGNAPGVLIGHTHLDGGPAIGPTCANVTDELYVSYPNTCP